MDTKQKIDWMQAQQKNGVFYPQDYTVVVLAPTTDMNELQRALTDADWPVEQNIQLSGQEFLTWHRQNKHNQGTLEKLQSMVAEIAGQETEFIKTFVSLAEEGHQFVIMHTPTPEDDDHMIETVQRFNPVKLSDYRIGSIVDLEFRQADTSAPLVAANNSNPQPHKIDDEPTPAQPQEPNDAPPLVAANNDPQTPGKNSTRANS